MSTQSSDSNPLKQWHEKHIAGWSPNKQIKDRKVLAFPRDSLADYPHLIAACDYLNGMYAELTGKYQASVQEEEQDETKREQGWLYRQMKRLRRKLGPQLMLALDYIERVWFRDLSEELKLTKEVKIIVLMVQKDKKKYMEHEPIFSLYLPYIRTKSLRAAETSSMDDVLTRRLQLMYVRSAITNATIRIGGLARCFPKLQYLVPSANLSSEQIARTISRAAERLRQAETEWRMIERYVEYWVHAFADDEPMLVTLEDTITVDIVQKQIQGIQEDRAKLVEIEATLPPSIEGLSIQ